MPPSGHSVKPPL